MSAVVDPSAFDQAYFAIPGYRQNAEMFFHGVKSNGLLLVDPEGQLQECLVETILSLPTQYGQWLRIWLEELLKNKRKRIIRCNLYDYRNRGKCNLLELAYQLKTLCNIDALILSNQSLEELKSRGVLDSGIIPLAEYSNSEFERLRGRYMEELPPIDQLTNLEVDDIIIRTIRFARWLRFYDKVIGTGNNTSHFREGIAYVLTLWQKHGHFASRGEGNVEIITCQGEDIRPHESPHVQESKARRNKAAYEKIICELVEPLKRKFPWRIDLKVKKDEKRIFHARHLEAQVAIVQLDPGFDIFKPDGTISRRSFIQIGNGHYDHLKECRTLPDAKFE